MEIKKAVKKMEKVRDRSGILSSRSRTPLPKLMQSCQSFYAICNRISLRRRGALLYPLHPLSTTGLPIDSTWLRLKTSLSLFPSLSPSLTLSLTFLRFGRKKSVLRFFSTFPPSFQPPLLTAFPPIFVEGGVSIRQTRPRSHIQRDKARGLWIKFLPVGSREFICMRIRTNLFLSIRIFEQADLLSIRFFSRSLEMLIRLI